MGRPKGTLVFDVETHAQKLLWSMPPERFVRLIGYRWKEQSDVRLTTELDELREQILRARWIIGHNIHAFDLPAVFGTRSDIPLQLAEEGRVYDTWTHAVLVNPAPYTYVNRFGNRATADKPEKMKSWFGLDEQAHQLGVHGKTADLKELAREFGAPELTGKAKMESGFGLIPVDDVRYQDYLRGDVTASDRVARQLLELGPLDDYAMREQRLNARAFVIRANGFRVHQEVAQARVDELAARREVIMLGLVERYGLPTEGAAPWDTKEGKQAVMSALADYGITPEAHPDWPKTPVWSKRDEKLEESAEKIAALESQIVEWTEQIDSGELKKRSVEARRGWIDRAREQIEDRKANPLPPAFGLSLGGEELISLTKGTEAEELGQALAELKGQRSLAQLALDSVYPDGYVHPSITMLQRSGRWSTTEPGLTIWTARGPGAVEKAYFGPDNDDEVLLAVDYSNADARIVAALSGDEKYAERFEEGADGHLINAWAAWGRDVVGEDKDNPETARYRQMAKPLGHGWSYGGQYRTLAAHAGVSEEVAKAFCDGMAAAFPRIIAWQNSVRRKASRDGYVMSQWGRKLYVEKGREFTQAPALLGQNGTREIIADAILSFPRQILRRLKVQVHDELIFSVPRANWQAWRDKIVELMETSFGGGRGGQKIDFPVSVGPAADNWYEATH